MGPTLPMPTANIHEHLQALTQEAVLHFRTRLLTTEPELRARISSSAYISSLAPSVMTAVSLILKIYPFTLRSLPECVLRRICRYLPLGDTMRLSATSRAMRATLLGIPDLWTDVYADSSFQQRGPAAPDTRVLASYLERSGNQPLRMNMFITYDLLVTSDLASVLERSMHRISCLGVEFRCDTPPRTRNGWECLNQQVLCKPAPLLRVLDMTVFNGPVDDIDDPGWTTLGELSLGAGLFGGHAPQFHACRLFEVCLPPREHCGVFRNITVFSYRLRRTLLSDEVELIAEVMPALETFSLGGLVRGGDAHTDGPRKPAFRSLRFLQLWAGAHRVRTNMLFNLISFKQLIELSLVESSVDRADALVDFAAVYPAMDTLRLSLHQNRLVGRLTCATPSPATPTRAVTSTLPRHSSLPAWLARYPPLVHLELHEIYLNNNALGRPPPLPHVLTLAVHLARCVEWHYHAWQCSGIVPDAAHPWELPSLQEVRIAPSRSSSGDERRCGYAKGPCVCARPLRIALREVADWVRHGLAFDAAKLEGISFSGVQVVDVDFCAAWNDVLEIACQAELSEDAGPDEGADTRMQGLFVNWKAGGPLPDLWGRD